MKKKYSKIISIFLCGLLIFQQTCFAEVVSVELNIASHFTPLSGRILPDKFRPLHLRSISYDQLNNRFNLLLDKGDIVVPSEKEIEDTTKDLLNYFFVGLALPNGSFWVNLRPDSPNDVIDPLLAETEVGRILLEADLQLKKDTADATDPATAEGRKYWNKLYQKAGEIYGDQNVTIPTLTRPWIVPDEIIIRESTGSAYVYKATLKVMLEQDYLKGSSVYSFKDPKEKQLNEYASQIIKEDIIPRLTKEINNAKRYASLRQVYYSLILAQWFKARNQGKNTKYSRIINKKNLSNLYAKPAYSVNDYFNAYKENFAKGQYNIKEPVATPYGQVVRSYFSGGFNMGEIITTDFGQPAQSVNSKVTLAPASESPLDNSDTVIGLEAVPMEDNPGEFQIIQERSGDLKPSTATTGIDANPAIATKIFSGTFNDFFRILKNQVSNNAIIEFLPYLWDGAREFTKNEFLEYLTSYKDSKNIYFPSGTMMFLKVIESADGAKRYVVLASETHSFSKPKSPNGKIIGYHQCSLKAALDITRDGFYSLPERWVFSRESRLDASTMEFMGWEVVLAFTLNASDLKELKTPGGETTQIMFDLNANKNGARLPQELRKKLEIGSENNPILAGDEAGFLVYLNPETIDINETLRINQIGVKEGRVAPAAFEKLKEYLESINVENKQNLTNVVNYFDPDQGKAMEFLAKDKEQSWVVFGDMLKLSLRNDYYGMDISDVFIADVIRITKKVLNKKGISFRLGERSDEIAMVLPGYLEKEEVENVLKNIQEEIKNEYVGYSIARLPDGMLEKIKGSTGVRMSQRTARESRQGGGREEYITTVLFAKDSGDLSGRSTLDRILVESGQVPGLGEIEPALPPYLPAGASRLQAGDVLESRFESSLKEAEILQRVAKQNGNLVGVEGLIEKPAVAKEGARLGNFESSEAERYIKEFKISSRGLKDFIEKHHGSNRAKQIELDNSYAAFIRSNLYDILEYTISMAKAADRSIFVVRGPPDSFYFITSAKGKWQVTVVRQNILTVEGSSLEKDFLSIIESSGRKLRVPGKYPFKVVNDFNELGHYFGNQLIVLDNLSLLDAFSLRLAGENTAILDEQSINGALQEASGNINNLLGENGFGFSVSFEAISVTSDDFLGQEDQPAGDLAKTALEIIEKLNASRRTVSIPDDTVKFYSEYKDRWSEIEKEIGLIAAERASNAQTELERVYASIKTPGVVFDSQSAIVFSGEEAAAELPALISAANEALPNRNKPFLEKIFLLFGSRSGNGYRIEKIIPVSEYLRQQDDYVEADPVEIGRIIDIHATGEIKLLGVLHTHPYDGTKIVTNPGPSWQDGLGKDFILPDRLDKIINDPIGIVIEAALPEGISIQGVEDINDGKIVPGINAYFYLTEESRARVFKVVDFNEWVKQISGGQSDKASPPDNSGGTDVGGIDFRFLPIVTVSMDKLRASIRNLPFDNLRRMDLVQEWKDIERLLNSSIPPSAERLKDYFAASYFEGSFDSNRDKIVSCISDILRMEEQSCVSTDPVLKDMLVVLGSGRSAKELKTVFSS